VILFVSFLEVLARDCHLMVLEAHPPKLLLKASASRQAPYSGECVTGSIRDRTTSVVAGSRTGTNVMVGQAWQASQSPRELSLKRAGLRNRGGAIPPRSLEPRPACGICLSPTVNSNRIARRPLRLPDNCGTVAIRWFAKTAPRIGQSARSWIAALFRYVPHPAEPLARQRRV